MGKRVKDIAVVAAVVGGIGYLAGILTAPKSGKETRQDIKETAVRARRVAEKELKDLHTQLTTFLDKAKSGIKTNPELQAAVERASAAKAKASDMLSALHEGGAQDKDLRQAIEDISDALAHLKTFFDKK